MATNLYFIDSKRCDMFSTFNNLDLEDLLFQINNFYLEYRATLNLPSHVSFGTEIEYERLNKMVVDKFIGKYFENWESKTDTTVKSGGEITSPILHDNPKTWTELKSICKFLRSNKVVTERNAGGHIHIGAHILENDCDNWRKFLKIYTAYEGVLFRFGYGDKLNARRILPMCAFSLEDILYYKMAQLNEVSTFQDMKKVLPVSTKSLSISFSKVRFSENDNLLKNTLEFRFPNATDEEIIWQNNINVFAKLMLAPINEELDEEFLDYKLKNERIPFKDITSLYNKVRLKEALEFADLVFDNNLDKVYFLRQYIKDFEETDNRMIAVKSKKFVNNN